MSTRGTAVGPPADHREHTVSTPRAGRWGKGKGFTGLRIVAMFSALSLVGGDANNTGRCQMSSAAGGDRDDMEIAQP